MAHILIVDDEPAVRNVLEQILLPCGHTILSTGYGIIALKKLSETPFDLIITDIVMPDMSGIKLISEARTLYPKIKILAISGGGPHYNSETCVTVAREYGADNAMTKPILREKLIDMVDELLAKPSL
ncbi:MAG: response regulator [Kiritimatiellales bacterium]|nr:response regulator [Kiritimatiellota bacterium]MBL7012420.1 response regulator [Kiritimatiellales bacterium]